VVVVKNNGLVFGLGDAEILSGMWTGRRVLLSTVFRDESEMERTANLSDMSACE